MVVGYADLPIHIECPKCGAKNMRTNNTCSSCDASLVEVKEKLLEEIAKSRGSTYETDPFAGEKRVGLIPRVRTFQFAGLGHRVMDGTVILTDKRLLFAAYKAGSVKSIWGIAGSKGGILGSVASAGTVKMRVGGPNDVNLYLGPSESCFYPTNRSTHSANTSLYRSTSFSVVSGETNAM